MSSFLDSAFLDSYKCTRPCFGFNGIGELVYLRTYSRQVVDTNSGKRRLEKWWETVKRVVDGCFENFRLHLKEEEQFWESRDMSFMAKKMFQHMFWLRFLPGGRGLWAMGTEIKDHAALNNCAFVSTKPLEGLRWSESFCFMMNSMMLGVGVGYDTEGKGYPVHSPDSNYVQKWFVHDSREGWVDSLRELIDAYTRPSRNDRLEFDYSMVRPKGVPLKTFGGIASGPAPLKLMHERVRALLQGYAEQKKLTDTRLIVDLANIVGAAVVAGGIRRTAMIALEKRAPEELMDLKDYTKYPERAEWGWASNNSLVLRRTDFEDSELLTSIAENVLLNGEPGVFLLENAQNFGRFCDGPGCFDEEAEGTNPCGEQTLHNYEMCNLVEVFLPRFSHTCVFKEVLFYALLYAKVVSTMLPENPHSRKVMEKNRRIGIGLTGIADFLASHTMSELEHWCKEGYSSLKRAEERLLKEYQFPRSVRLTTVKPSGTLSLLAGCCPGVHFPIGHKVIRRICLNENDSFLVGLLKQKGFHVYEDSGRTYAQTLIEYDPRLPTDRGMWEQLFLVQLMQSVWADNQVSATIYIPQGTQVPEIVRLLKLLPNSLKSVSMLPENPLQKYRNMPYEPVTADMPVPFTEALTPLERAEFLWLPEGAPPEKEETPEVFCERCEEHLKKFKLPLEFIE